MRRHELSIPTKANKILNLVLVFLLLIGIRIWHLSTWQHEEKMQESEKPQKRTLVQKPTRASIRDRFNEPLAQNRVQYSLQVVYSKIQEIPQKQRKAHIKQFSKKIAEITGLDAERTEDLIYAKAALLGSIPLLLKENLSEKEFYKLKMLEKEYPGLLAACKPVRFYPKGRTACDIVGYMGAISKEEFDGILSEMRLLQNYIQEEESGVDVEPIGFDAKERLQELQERAYTINDYVGKAGIEGAFDEELRGFRGKKTYFSDIRGRFLKELPGTKEALSGKRFLLTISSELQEFAEALLAENEQIREGKSIRLNRETYRFEPIKQPWIKGGAIIAMDPNTGEILAMASYPRFDPNDFIFSSDLKKQMEQKSHVYNWLENDFHVAELWDQKQNLKRELYSFKNKSFYEEEKEISWENYLDFILPKEHPVTQTLGSFDKLEHAYRAQNGEDGFLAKLSSYDKTLALDLYKVAIDAPRFSKELIEAVGKKTLSHYKKVTAAFLHVQEDVKEIAETHFQKVEFATWKETNAKNFLKEKRAEEKQKRTYQKPYLDYLDKKEKELFAAYWKKNQFPLIYTYIKEKNKPGDKQLQLMKEELSPLSESLALHYLATFRGYSDLKGQLLGRYPFLRSIKGVQLEKHLAAAFYPKHGFGYARSFAFRQAAQLGSIFKLMIAYTALLQGDGNPLTIVDDFHANAKNGGWNIGYTEQGATIPQFYRGGRMPKSQHSHIGKINLKEAIETSSNPYFSLLAGDVIKAPQDIVDIASQFSYGCRTGIMLPGEISGSLPKDLHENKTGLYAFAIGQHTFVATPLQTAVMTSALVNGGKVLEPQIVRLQAEKEAVKESAMTVRREIAIPSTIRHILFDGMKQVIHGKRGTAKPSLIRSFSHRPTVIKDYMDLENEIIGKTSTAELQERIDISQKGMQMVNHIGFAGISFEKGDFSKPELVVIVYLKFGDWGKEAAPLATQIIKKWREIKDSCYTPDR